VMCDGTVFENVILEVACTTKRAKRGAAATFNTFKSHAGKN
jgi:hypothetical protein